MTIKMKPEHYSLTFLEGATAKEINGKKYLEVNGELVNIAESISEATFVRDWLLGFSLGYINDKSYFDFSGWMNLSNECRSAVAVHDNENENDIVFVIPPMTDTKMTHEELMVLQTAAGVMSNANGAQFGGSTTRSTEILLQGLEIIKNGLRSGAYTITDLIPKEIYKKYGINPPVFKKMIYCRDVLGVDPEKDEWKVLEACFKIIEDKKTLHQQQVDFLNAVGRGTIIIPEECLPENKKEQEDQSTESSPYEC